MGHHTKPHTAKLYQPTDDIRRQVLTMTGFGIKQEDIATSLQIDKKTLHKHFRRELDTGMIEANVRVAKALYQNAVQHNNVAAQIWWTKTRMGWKEAQDLNIGGTDRPLNVSFRWADATPTLSNPNNDQSSNVTWIEATATDAE
jgi:hypothetical protein